MLPFSDLLMLTSPRWHPQQDVRNATSQPVTCSADTVTIGNLWIPKILLAYTTNLSNVTLLRLTFLIVIIVMTDLVAPAHRKKTVGIELTSPCHREIYPNRKIFRLKFHTVCLIRLKIHVCIPTTCVALAL